MIAVACGESAAGRHPASDALTPDAAPNETGGSGNLVGGGGGGSDAEARDGAARDAGGAEPDGGDAGQTEAKGTLTLESCRKLSGVDESCTLFREGSACVNARCAKLVIIFAGGEQGCATGKGYADVMAKYSAAGWAAVCINYFETSDGSAVVPYADEAPRLDVAVKAATTGTWAKRYWTGEELLIEGISHGATAPVILMARTTLDDAPHWRGTRKTAACFFDGSYDQVATATLLKTGGVGGGPCRLPVPYTRWLQRYCGPGATAATCDLASLASVEKDNVTQVDAEAYAVRSFKMIECGSATPVCNGDILPAAPIAETCATIDAGADHVCVYESLPDATHLVCHQQGFERCGAWFDTL
jgi:hypothetical protein